jgi:hypothetical protein
VFAEYEKFRPLTTAFDPQSAVSGQNDGSPRFVFRRKGGQMNREKTFRSRFNRRMNGLQDSAEHLEETVKEQANAIAEQTKEGWMRGQKAVSTWERQLEDSMRGHPMLYLGAAMSLVGLLLAKMLLDLRRHR